MKRAMAYTLHDIGHILCPSKLSLTHPKDGWLAKGLVRALFTQWLRIGERINWCTNV